MLETLNLEASLDRTTYRNRIREMRYELRDLQLAVRRARIPVVIVLEGWMSAGKGDTIAQLVHPLDPRGFRVATLGPPTEEERRKPPLTRYWEELPGRGEFAFYYGSWHRRLLDERIEGQTKRSQIPAVASEIRDFERQLTLDGHVLVKMWLHISRKEQKRRWRTVRKDRYEKWRALRPGTARKPGYDALLAAAEEMIERTSTGSAPWTLIEATDPYFRRAKAFETMLTALRVAVRTAGAGARRPRARKPDATLIRKAARIKMTSPPGVLDRADLTNRLDRPMYERRLDRLQKRMRQLHERAYQRRMSIIIVYEGWDAAGKGGSIKRVTQELDPRGYEVVPIAAPDATEAARHYLWRFWFRLPRSGHIAIFDRSWYGRVLVERIEGFASEAEWRRAYREINDFERQLHQFGSVIVKFWMHISPEEQLRRFREREKTAHKKHKLTADDWRNRLKWNDYHAAVTEMVERTSSTIAPWTIIEAEDKLWARIQALGVITRAVARRLKA